MARIGIEDREELGRRAFRDVRSLAVRRREDLPPKVPELLLWLALGMVVFAPLDVPLFVIGIGLFLFANGNRLRPRFYYCAGDAPHLYSKWEAWREGRERGADYSGCIYAGQEMETGQHVFVPSSVWSTHSFFFGTTGSGKTMTLLGLAYQIFVNNGGLMLVDGKADIKTFGLLYSLARRFDRINDFRLMNFLTAVKSEHGNPLSTERHVGKRRITNSFNPFEFGSSDEIKEILSGLMSDSSGDGDFWKGRARTLLVAVVSALVAKRDAGEIDLDVKEIRKAITYNGAAKLASDPNLSFEARNPLVQFFANLPGFNWAEFNAGKFSQKAHEQFGYVSMQLVEALSLFADTYGHITNVKRGEIQFASLIRDRKILYVMLPTIDKSPDSVRVLGKIQISMVRTALAPLLGADVQGNIVDIIYKNPANADFPFFIILDEWKAYMARGGGTVSAQARSLGVAVIFATQALSAMEEVDKMESKESFGNTGIKGLLKTDCKETVRAFQDQVGQAAIGRQDSLEWNSSSGKGAYRDTDTTRTEFLERASYRDIKAQQVCEMHLNYGDKLFRVYTPMATPLFQRPRIARHIGSDDSKHRFVSKVRQFFEVQDYRIPTFLPLSRPTKDEVRLVRENLAGMYAKYTAKTDSNSPPRLFGIQTNNLALSSALSYLSSEPEKSPMQASLGAIAWTIQREHSQDEELRQKSNAQVAVSQEMDQLFEDDFDNFTGETAQQLGDDSKLMDNPDTDPLSEAVNTLYSIGSGETGFKSVVVNDKTNDSTASATSHDEHSECSEPMKIRIPRVRLAASRPIAKETSQQSLEKETVESDGDDE